ncbi:unnamed protein product [Orchesella dallaii]|uniref:Tudor domain-containing protein n=1 Tax=Orchesella dallaii TaxID=48710 RepID=A0ABP1RR80_9HEXA
MASSSSSSNVTSRSPRGIDRGRGSLQWNSLSLQVRNFLGASTAGMENPRNYERDADLLDNDRFYDAISPSSSPSFHSLQSSSESGSCPQSQPNQLTHVDVTDVDTESQLLRSSSSSTIFYDCLTSSSNPTLSDSESQSDVYENETSEPEPNDLPPLLIPDRFENYSVNLERKVNNGNGIDLLKKIPAGIPTRIKVVGVMKPLCIFVQSEGNARKVKCLKGQLKKSSLKKIGVEQISEGVYVVVKFEDELYRGQIEEVDYFTEKCWIRLVDTGAAVLRPFPCVYELPNSFLRIFRQVGSVSIWDVEPTNETRLFSYLQSHLVGKVVSLQITHSYLGSHYYASSLTINGEKTSLSNNLIQEGLAVPCTVMDSKAKSLINGFEKIFSYEPPFLDTDEVANVYITNVMSLTRFYVRKRHTEDVQNRIEFALRTVLESGSSTSVDYGASRMFILLANPYTSERKPCRVFCHELDFTVAPGQARVILIDFGFVCNVPARDLMEYSHYLNEFPPLAYRVAIDVQPISVERFEELTECLKEIMSFSKKGGNVQVKCVRQSATKGKSYVKLMSTEWDKDWNQALQEIGYAKRNFSKENKDEPLNASVVNIPVPSSSFWEFKTLNSTFNIGIGDESSVFPYSFTSIPAAISLKVGDVLKPRKLKGVYMYLVMTRRCYELHQQLRKYCVQLVASGKSDVGDHVFKVGEVVLAPWNTKTYQRCCITGFENKEGNIFARAFAFDIEQTQSFLVSKLKRPDDFIMMVEKLSHVVWLEDTNEDTRVFSQDFNSIIQCYCEWAQLSNMRELPNNKLVVRLRILNANSKFVLLAKLIHELERWNWEKFFNAGFLSHHRLVTKLRDKSEWNLSHFLKEGMLYNVDEMVKGLCKVQVRQVELNHSHSMVTIMVIPQTSNSIEDFRAIRWQMNRFYEKVSYVTPSENSPTFPKIVALREAFEVKATRKVSSPCQWHRSIYIADKKCFECVDCFHQNEVYAGVIDLCDLGLISELNNWDIREICPEMLRIAPIGKRLSVKLPQGDLWVKRVVQESLKLGVEIEVRVQKPTPFQQQMTLCADVPLISNRLSLIKDAQAGQQSE